MRSGIMVETALDAKPVPVLVGFAPPAPQRRATVGFRIILLIPHIVFIMLLSIAAEMVVFISWFAALLLGRVPEPMFDFLSGVLRYTTRVIAYICLLTDQYPPFELDHTEYPISVAVAPTKLNRAAVFFRIVLIIPAYLVSAMVLIGLEVVGVFIWLIVLVTGTMPRSLYEAVAATVRYQTRFTAYMMLLTPVYPAGLFGDRAAVAMPPTLDLSASPPAADAVSAGPDAPSALADSPDGYLPPPPPIGLGASPTSPPRATRLVLSKAAKRVVGLFVALGVLTNVGTIALFVVSADEFVAIAKINRDYAQLRDSVNTFVESTKACGAVAALACVQQADTVWSGALTTFADQVHEITFPARAKAAAAKVEADARGVAAQLRRMATASTQEEYQSLVPAVQSQSTQFDVDYNSLAAQM